MSNVGDAFQGEGKSAVQAIRRAFAEILTCVGGDPSQPQDLARQFGLDKTLTWRIARVVREEDAWEAVQHIPRPPSIAIFSRAMARHGARPEQLETLSRAVDEFERFVHVHCGDRETLEAMVSGVARRTSDKRMEAFRRDGFHANAAVWGVRARLQISMHILVPGATPETLESATIAGFADLSRLRPNVPWNIASAAAWDERGMPLDPDWGRPLPLHPGGLMNGVPILPQFCSDQCPPVRAVFAPGSNSRFELVGGPVGNAAATTIILGWKWPDSKSRFETVPDETGEHGFHMSTPVESAVLDLLVHKSLTFVTAPVAGVYSELPGGPRYPEEGVDIGRLPVSTAVVDLGSGPPDVTMPDLPAYREMAEFGASRLGYSIGDFFGFRYRISYPPIPSIGVIRHALLKRAP